MMVVREGNTVPAEQNLVVGLWHSDIYSHSNSKPHSYSLVDVDACSCFLGYIEAMSGFASE